MKPSSIVAATAMMAVITVPAMAQQSHEEHVACELAARNCMNKAEILEKRVKKLNAEIKKGSSKYSAEDLKALEQKLKETQELLDKVEGKTPAK